MIGTTLSHYRLTAKIGEGGMGVVYKAEDTKLGRTVALKFVRAGLLESGQHKERFVREAQATAALDHPNICTIHEIDEVDGQTFIAMAFVDGENLRQKIAGRPMKLEEAIDLAIQISEGLQAAHTRGIVHRDIKPANVMVNAQGKLKIMDFGLAHLADRSSVTQTATILGTPGYMSPEQAQGVPVDRRSDLWSLGVVLYEMVTGRLPFRAEHEAAMLHGILYEEHEPVTALRAGVPLDLDRIIDKSLAKRTEDRYQHAEDFLIDLRQLRRRLEPGGSRRASGRAPLRPATSTSLERITWALLVTALLVLSGWLYFRNSTPVTPVMRVIVNVTPADRLRALRADDGYPQGRPSRTAIALSPDGRLVVFSAVRGEQQQLFVRPLDALEAVAIAGTNAACCPFFSPDGQWIGFWSNRVLRKVALSGGPAVPVADVPSQLMSASWGAADTIVFTTVRGPVWRVPARGGKPDRLTTLDASRGEVSHRHPQILPDGSAVLFTVTHDSIPNWERTEIFAQRLQTGERVRLIEGGADARYLASGHLLYVRNGTLMAAPFDASRVEIMGGSIGMVPGVMQAANMGYDEFDSGSGQFSVSDTGSLAYVAGGPLRDPEHSLVWVDRRSGKVEPLKAPPGYYLGPRLSPDGARVAVAVFSADIARRNVWIHDIGQGRLTPLTSGGDSGMPIWTRDGARVVFPSGGAFSGNLFWTSADGLAKPERLSTNEFGQVPSSISRDGALIFTQAGDIWVMGLDRKVTPAIESSYYEAFPDLSPDGRWLAYASTESGRLEVWIRPFLGPGGGQKISMEGGQSPVWRNDGRELFYHSFHPAPPGEGEPLRMMAVPVTATSTGLTFGPAKTLFEGPYFPTAPVRGYDVTPDGQRFLMVRMDGKRPLIPTREIIFVHNWARELTDKLPRR